MLSLSHKAWQWLLLCQLGGCFVPAPLRATGTAGPDFNWTNVEPTRQLIYHDCYEEYKCARLIVPLDWTNKSNPNEIALGITKLPAKVPSNHASFGGTIVMNPGGPSGSGTDDVRYNGHSIQNIVDGDKHFEILSFDPRGVHRTTPSPLCFDTPEARDIFTELNKLAGGSDVQTSLDIKWALAQGLGQLCADASYGVYSNGDNIKQYVTTALVAYDMVRIIDAVAEEREGSSTRGKPAQQRPVAASEKPLLNYWGFSYGTFLGNTFASMFPSRIGRMILDGNVDAPDYAATGWSTNLNDNNLVWRNFFDWCFEAGPSCALYDQQFQNPLKLHEKVIDLFEDVKTNPIPYVDEKGRINVLTYFNLEFTMHPYAYNPWHSWPRLASNIASLINGDPLPFLGMNSTKPPTEPLPNTTSNIPPHEAQPSTPDDRFLNSTTPYPPSYPHGLEAAVSILCGDGEPLTTDTKASYSTYVSHLVNQSALIGPTWAQITLPCRHWPTSLRPADRNRFTGPFGSKLRDYASSTGWARPLLFIGNTADPVTPVRNARAMSAKHEGSAVLTQDAPGHCSGPTHPSSCVWDAIRVFMNEGRLPEEGTVCQVDWKPWDRKVGA